MSMQTKINVGVIGGTGYVGIELIRLLQAHPYVVITYISSETYAGQPISDVYPHLRGVVDTSCESINIERIAAECDLIFLAVPHGQAMGIVPALLSAGKKVIDLSADFRLQDPKDYELWYQHASPDIAVLKRAVYGLPELGCRTDIANASLIANPGCYPTAIALAAMPALKSGWINPKRCIFDAKSGISGAGRAAKTQTHYCEIAENLVPYQVGGQHRHIPEIEQTLSNIHGAPLKVQFTPHLVPIMRGMLITAYFECVENISAEAIHAYYESFYVSEPFVRVVPIGNIPHVNHVRGTNYCHVGVFLDERTQSLIVISVIDNLVKGASGQAVQNMNLMYRWPELTALETSSIYP